MKVIEREIVILDSAWEMIGRMVSWAMFVKNNRKGPTNLLFESREHSLLFVILFADFLSEIRAFRGPPPFGMIRVPSNARPSDLTFIFHLRQVYADPRLGTNATGLSTATEALAQWLEGSFVAHNVNLHSIDVVADLHVARYRYLKMCGDIAKHNLARLETNVRHLRTLLQAAGHKVSEQEAYLAVENFFEWFHDHIFIYHSSLISEMLNEIRWEIFHYLEPEYQRSWHLTREATPTFPLYGYHLPDQIAEPIARAMYWNLMNRVRAKPCMHRFIVSDTFKGGY